MALKTSPHLFRLQSQRVEAGHELLAPEAEALLLLQTGFPENNKITLTNDDSLIDRQLKARSDQ